MVFLAYALFGPHDRGMMMPAKASTRFGIEQCAGQDFLAHYRNAEHLRKKCTTVGPRQGAEVVNDNAVEAVVDERQEVAKQLGE